MFPLGTRQILAVSVQGFPGSLEESSVAAYLRWHTRTHACTHTHTHTPINLQVVCHKGKFNKKKNLSGTNEMFSTNLFQRHTILTIFSSIYLNQDN